MAELAAQVTESGIRKPRMKVEPDRAIGAKGRGVDGRLESQGGVWLTTDQGRTGGTREPGGASGIMVETRDAGSKV